jgi:uncharacterized protein (DUF58 family)
VVIEADDIARVRSSTLIGLHRDAQTLPLISNQIKAQVAGGFLSSFRGRGMEFDESRLYQPGDDIRSIDWRVTARSGRTHTKIYREERERPVLLWLDLSRSMFFGSRNCFKAVLAAKLTALFAWSSVQQGDRLGGLIYSEQDHVEFRPMSGRRSCLHLIQKITSHPAWDQTQQPGENLTASVQALARLRQVSKPGSLIILFSDFRFMNEESRFHLARMARHNDVILIFTHDPLEQALPPAGQYRLTDGVRKLWFDSSSEHARQKYEDRFGEQLSKLQQLALKHRLHLIDVSTADDWLNKIRAGLGLRSHKSVAV